MPRQGLKRRNAKKDQVTKYIQMGMLNLKFCCYSEQNFRIQDKLIW